MRIYHCIDRIGDKYGHLTIIAPAYSPKGRNKRWLCKCECGVEKVICISHLRNGGTVSCGCKKIYLIRASAITHGFSRDPNYKSEYSTWAAMKARCSNPKKKNYKDYGGRGIKVCERWLNSFENFLEDMGKKPSKEYSLDREENDGNYEPNNCRWALLEVQSRNKRTSNFLECNGERMVLLDWAKKLNVERRFIYKFLERGITFCEIIEIIKTGKHRDRVLRGTGKRKRIKKTT